jgi:low affinity Fe/Cu permease
MADLFRAFSQRVARLMGTSWAFLAAVALIIVWAVTGPLFHFSDTWQLVINTGTNIITFLMVFLIQNTQNRDAVAIHLTLDELLRAVEGARTGLVDLEDLSDAELARLREQFARLHESSHQIEEVAAD